MILSQLFLRKSRGSRGLRDGLRPQILCYTLINIGCARKGFLEREPGFGGGERVIFEDLGGREEKLV